MAMKNRQLLAFALSGALVISTLGGCSAFGQLAKQTVETGKEYYDQNKDSEQEDPSSQEDATQGKTDGTGSDGTVKLQDQAAGQQRIYLNDLSTQEPLRDYTPSVAAYQTAPDLSNIENLEQFYAYDTDEDISGKLAANNFIVMDSGYSEFFDVYEYNRYSQVPSFVTVDSMMHTYHLYFALLQRTTERDYLASMVKEMSHSMYQTCLTQYEELKGSEWEQAAALNVGFFAVGVSLMGDEAAISIPDEVKNAVDQELSFIEAADGIYDSALFEGEMEDYSQYKPRGYYEGEEALEQYFRAMMWYGRRNFAQKQELTDRAALLMTMALSNEAFQDWEAVYTITSFFAGASDDSGFYEYAPLIREAYGDGAGTGNLIGNEAAFDAFHELTGKLDPPAINSAVFMDDNGETDKTQEAKGFRFMGQRFTLDEAIFTNLTYSKVRENADGSNRMLPMAMDVPAVLGSDTAKRILEDNGAFEYQGYAENMEKLQNAVQNADDTLWNGSLYAGWLQTLCPLLEERDEGYPSFMRNEEWRKKNLESFLGSYTELKHDTVLYSKQMLAEMGGGMEEMDDRGYVEPEPEIFHALGGLAKNTSEGMERFGILSAEDKENLEKLQQLSDQLAEISIKELEGGSTVTDEDYELIRTFGGNLEHFWKETIRDQTTEEYVDSREFPAALVVDIATDPNGTILEEAIGGVSRISVVVPVDGKLRLAVGGTFSYYEFTVPIDSRMTDSEWRQMIGMELNDDMEYEYGNEVEQPSWTKSYRYSWDG